MRFQIEGTEIMDAGLDQITEHLRSRGVSDTAKHGEVGAGWRTTREIANALTLPLRATRHRLETLENQGVVVGAVEGSSYIWRLATPSEANAITDRAAPPGQVKSETVIGLAGSKMSDAQRLRSAHPIPTLADLGIDRLAAPDVTIKPTGWRTHPDLPGVRFKGLELPGSEPERASPWVIVRDVALVAVAGCWLGGAAIHTVSGDGWRALECLFTASLACWIAWREWGR